MLARWIWVNMNQYEPRNSLVNIPTVRLDWSWDVRHTGWPTGIYNAGTACTASVHQIHKWIYPHIIHTNNDTQSQHITITVHICHIPIRKGMGTRTSQYHQKHSRPKAWQWMNMFIATRTTPSMSTTQRLVRPGRFIPTIWNITIAPPHSNVQLPKSSWGNCKWLIVDNYLLLSFWNLIVRIVVFQIHRHSPPYLEVNGCDVFPLQLLWLACIFFQDFLLMRQQPTEPAATTSNVRWSFTFHWLVVIS